jgi:predicted O-methyltransferase YrrM
MMNKRHILKCLANAIDSKSKLPQEILDLPGFCPPRIRHFLNSLCDFEGCNYLEIGTFKGASLLSAAFKNSGRFTAIDNFSEFDGTRDILLHSIDGFKDVCKVNFIEGDCWEIPKEKLPEEVNVYFYDGNHSEESQERGLTQFDSILANCFVILVDDYSWAGSLAGTEKALKKLNYKLDLKVELHDDGNKDGWWNGLFVLLAEKQ